MAAKLARWNTALLIAILAINLYVIALPVLPRISFWWNSRGGEISERLEASISFSGQGQTPPENPPHENRLVVPSMLLDEPIFEDRSPAALRKGIWRRPRTGTPVNGGNTVLVAHRLTYSNPQGTFYNLDKVKAGDTIGLWWDGVLYRYTVKEVLVVPANRVDIEAQSAEPRLTLYTCTPLWLPKDRLVVIANPVTEDEENV